MSDNDDTKAFKAVESIWKKRLMSALEDEK